MIYDLLYRIEKNEIYFFFLKKFVNINLINIIVKIISKIVNIVLFVVFLIMVVIGVICFDFVEIFENILI